jgi:hypothetical protein
MTDKNRFSILGDMGGDIPDPGTQSAPGTPATGQKRTLEDRSPDVTPDGRTKRINLMDLCVDTATDMDNLKKVLSTTTLTVNDKTSWKEAKDKFLGLFSTVVDTMERNMNTVTDVAAAVGKFQDLIDSKDKTIKALEEKIVMLERRKDSQEVKDSQELMASEIRQAMTHLKVMDLDMVKETDNRKDIIECAAKALNGKIRSDLTAKWAGATRSAKVVPLGKKTVKRQTDGKEINTVPVLIRIEDREERWQAEEVLRKSNVHPSFHWPQGMMGHVKKFRQEIVDSGVSESENYIRIRPEDKNGKLRIRGDVKAKTNGKFETKVYWSVPPFDNALISLNPELVKPQWTGPTARGRNLAPAPAQAPVLPRRSRGRSTRPSVTVNVDMDTDNVFSQASTQSTEN